MRPGPTPGGVKMRLFQKTPYYKRPLILLFIWAFAGCLNSPCLHAAATISYVQGNYSTPQSPQTAVAVTFAAAQSSGDLNIVVVGWNDSTATVKSVTDRAGNGYTLAVGPTVISGVASQSIYYATNIAAAAAGANTVTVTFSVAAISADIRILEYNGVATINALDVTAAQSGNSATSSSGSANTTGTTDLIFGANLVISLTSGPGSGFTERLLTSPDGDIAEDHVVTTIGSYSATAPVSPANSWIMQMVAFKAAGSISACDLNADGSINILDVQLATDMDLGTGTCSAPGLYCNPIFVQNVQNTALGQPCSLTVLGAIPSSVNFGSVVVGSTGTQSATLTVTGSGTTTISQVTATPATFTISGLSLPITLSSGNSATFNVSFTPVATGAASGNIAVVTAGTSNALNSPFRLPVSGSGVSFVPHSVSVSWNASTSSNVASYNVYRITSSSSTAPSTPYPSLVSKLAATSICSATTNVCGYTDSTVSAGTSYWYYATAVNTSNSESSPSNTAQAVVPSP